MAAPMRSSSQEAGHRARVADPRTGNATAKPDIPSSTTTPSITHHSTTTTSNPPTSSNFEYDDNEWDIGIGDLIIDLDADIEKTNDQQTAIGTMAANAGGPQAAKAAATAKMAIEHSATVDKGLKMKIKRMKPGTKTSEAKHEIVKSNELNGNADPNDLNKGSTAIQGGGGTPQGKHSGGAGITNNATPTASTTPSSNNSGNSSKRGSSSHRRDKIREKHGSSGSGTSILGTAPTSEKNSAQKVPSQNSGAVTTINVAEMNGMVRVSVPQTGPSRSVFPASTGPGPPSSQSASSGPSPGPPPSPAAATAQGSAAKPEQAKVAAATTGLQQQPPSNTSIEARSPSPPPKKLKTDANKDVSDVCIGTSVGTITEPDCLGPCEPGTSVTLEGIVWHETEGGVLVVNVTWRGKTYVGTLLDCTRHDWAPPRFCDSPTSDLDNRTPKGRGKRGRSGASTAPSLTATATTDLSNSTETRSSVHSKLRNGGGGGAGTSGSGVKGRRGTNSTNSATASGPNTAPSSPTPFVPPRPEPTTKRKSRAGDGDEPQTPPPPPGKKNKVASAAGTSSPPPSSPVLLECPEPNCSKKYKHINGLKYHQSHAHGSVDDEDTKDVTSMSENDESSNIEVPSPATPPVKSPPDKSQDSPQLKSKEELPMLLRGMEVGSSQPATPHSVDMGNGVVPEPAGALVGNAEAKSGSGVVKPGVLRHTPAEDYPVGVFSGKSGAPITSSGTLPASTPRNVSALEQPTQQIGDQQQQQQQNNAQLQSFSNQLQSQVNMPSQQFTQPPASLMIPPQQQQNASQLNTQQMSPQQQQLNTPQSPQNSQQQPPKIATPQFKVKPTASLMPDDKTKQQSVNKSQSFKKKNRKSPAGSPHPPEQPVFGVEQSGRDEVQSPAYSDISDDGAPPVIEADLSDKSKSTDKKTESGQSIPHMPQYGMYPFYGQAQYLVPSVQQNNDPKNSKDGDKSAEKPSEKDGKKESQQQEYPQKIMPQQHYYPYGYMPGYPYNMDPNFGGMPMVQEDKIKEERIKESPSPIIDQPLKASAPIPNPIQVPTPGKVKSEPSLKEKHQNDNHQILKESIEIKNQMNPYNVYSRSQQQQSHHSQRDEDVRRFYVFDQRRKESQQNQEPSQHKSSTPSKVPPPRSPSLKQHKESKNEEKKDKEPKNEGVKPTMETQGPPPPPTSQYAYIHPSYMQSAHYGALPFDPNHPMYRGIMVPGPYSGSPYLHAAQMPRYHAPEDLSRAPPPPPPKALEMLQHHAQYYSSHKIHELQERAIKSPTPKTSVASSSPSTQNAQAQQPVSVQSPMAQTAMTASAQQTNAPSGGQRDGKMTPQEAGGGGGKDSTRSPPPQRHVHTHHHTHVGLGYPMYPAPYGAAVLASQQASAVTVINPYPTK